MHYQTLPGTGKPASSIVLGTAWYGTDINEKLAFAMLDRYLELGGNLLDTANMYCNWVEGGNGKSETTIGKWLKANPGVKISVMTKGADRGMDFATIREQLQESLERLNLNKIDFYWLHRDDRQVSVDEILGWLNELSNAGFFPAFGCSNWRPDRIREAQKYAKQHNIQGFAANQIGWSLARPIPEQSQKLPQVFMNDETYRMHCATRLPCMGYSAQAGGFFGGKYDPDSPAGAKPNPVIVDLYGCKANYERLKRCRNLAKKYGKTPNQIALAYLFSEQFPGFAIAGAGNLGQLEDACGAGDIKLTRNEVSLLLNGKHVKNSNEHLLLSNQNAIY